MKNILKDLLVSGLGVLVVTKEKAEEMIEKMIKQGEITRKEGQELLKEFLQKSEQATNKISNQLSDEVKKKLKKAGFVTRDELNELQLQLNELKEEVHNLKMNQE